MSLIETWNFPTKIIFGCSSINQLIDHSAQLGFTKALIVTDPFLAESQIVLKILAMLEKQNMPYSLFQSVKSNPTDHQACEGKQQFLKEQCDGIIAIGGGSPLDTAKVIALMAHHDYTLDQLEAIGDNFDQLSRTIPSIIAIPTTAGTGSEVGRAALVHHTEQNRKVILFHPKLMPKVVIADPNLTIDLPCKLTAATGMDALSHCLEAYSAIGFHPSADGIAIEGMRLVKQALLPAFENGQNIEARSQMLVASQMGAIAFQKGLGAMHALSHAIGAIYDFHHGLLNAILMPYVLAYNREVIQEKLDRLEGYLDLPRNQGLTLLTWIFELREKLQIPNALQSLGMSCQYDDNLLNLAVNDPTLATNPIPLDKSQLADILLAAIEGKNII